MSFLQRQGIFKRKFDFELPGVTSISVDVHKYGFASKGASVIAFRSSELRGLSYVPVMDGLSLYVTPTIQGARSGAVIAAAWATMVHIGREGYEKAAATMWAAEERIKAGVAQIPELKLLCKSDLSVISIASQDATINIWVVASRMETHGWNMFTVRDPPAMNICVGERHGEIVDAWMEDLRESVAYVRAHPDEKPTGDAGTYSAASTLPIEVLDQVMRGYVNTVLKVKPSRDGA